MGNDQSKPSIKKPTTFKEQVELYRKRKLQVEDSELAESFLKRVNYYRLSAYRLTLKDSNPDNKENYKVGSTFEQLTSIYTFDKKMRHILIDVLESIEIAFRTHIAYLIAHKYEPLGYKDSSNFKVKKFHNDFLEELDKVINRSKKSEIFIGHYQKNYNGQFPIWVATEIMSFGMLSKLYKNLKINDKAAIAKEYYGLSYTYVESWLETLTYVRNVCAHYGRLYNKTIVFKPRLFKAESKLIDKSKLFAAIYVTIRLLPEADARRLVVNLEALIEEYKDCIEFKYIGFPNNWNTTLSTVIDQRHHIKKKSTSH
jgi:abortive infection bacteriophage resistance protein